jgi:hypothetical protein
MEWEYANATAMAWGGYLTTINDAYENGWIANYAFVHEEAQVPVWIGLTDAADEGTWVWANGENAAYRNWAHGEPNGGRSENHTEMWGGEFTGQWNDAWPDRSLPAVVEREDAPANADEGTDYGEAMRHNERMSTR